MNRQRKDGEFMNKLTDKYLLVIPAFFIVLASCSSPGSSSGSSASGMREETKQFCANNLKVEGLITRNFSVNDNAVLTLLADMDEWSGTASPSDELESKLAEWHLLLTESMSRQDSTKEEYIIILRTIDAYCIAAKNGNL